MKKHLVFLLSIVTMIIITGCGTADAKSTQEQTKDHVGTEAQTKENVSTEKIETTPEAANEMITLEEARAIALNDAGLSETDAQYILEKLDNDDGRAVYDIEFYHETTEYDYEIDAVTGDILEKDHEIENYEIPTKDTASADYISIEKAKEIALNHVELTQEEVRFGKMEWDEDDGKAVYQLEFHNGKTEYEFEIDAITGDILEFDKDHD